MTEKKSDGNKRTSRSARGAADTSASADDNRSSAGLFPGDGSGTVDERSRAVDAGVGRAEEQNSERASDGGRGVVGSGGSDDSSSGAGAGTSSGSGGGSDVAGEPAQEKRKRGRPKKEASTGELPPRIVPLSRLRGGKKKAKHDYSLPFAKGFKVLYEMPKYAGWGDHWPLSDGDALLLGGKLNDVVQELPKGQVHKLAEFFDKYINPYLPIASLATALYMVTEPRLAASKRLAEEARENERTSSSETRHEPVATSGSAEGNGSMYEGAFSPTAPGIGSERLHDETV